METLCSSGPPESLLPHLCLSTDRKWQGSELQERGEPGRGQARASQHTSPGQGVVGGRSLGRTRSALRELLTHHSHQ